MDEKGLYPKYEIRKRATGEIVDGECFVLRVDRDPAALVAMAAYAVVTDNKTLAHDIKHWVADILGRN